MKKKTLFVLSVALGMASATQLPARTWTDAATGRTLEGDYVKSDETHVVIRKTDRTVKIKLARLSDADKSFIQQQTAQPAQPARTVANPLARITAPISITPRPVKGTGDDRETGFEVTNNSGKTVSRLTVNVRLYNEDGGVEKKLPHTSDGWFGKLGDAFKKGQRYTIELSSFWVKENMTSVEGVVCTVNWEDGTTWPAWTGPAPQQEGDAPVSLVMKGVVGEGDLRLPLIECFNHGSRRVTKLEYWIHFLDEEGKELKKSRMGMGSGQLRIEPGEGQAFVISAAPPEGTADVTFSVSELAFADSPGTATYAALTPQQIDSRKDVDGGSWTVSFDEERYLGMIVVSTSEGGEQVRRFYWSPESAQRHAFHFDHHKWDGDHELTFSPAQGKEGDIVEGSGVTCHFRDPKHGSSETWTNRDLELRPAPRSIGKSVRGPVILYLLKSFIGQPTFVLKVVFVEDTAAAEKALNRVLDRQYGPR